MAIRSAELKDKAVTISDVAAHAGVSPMTVSRVINAEKNVREETRDQVLKSIDALNYKPNLSARALAGNKSYRLALLYGNPSAFYLSELLVSALEEISKHGHQLLVHKVSEEGDEKTVTESLSNLTGQYDGVIVPPPLSDFPSVRDFLHRNDIPAAFLSGLDGNGRSRKLCIDDYEAAKELTSYLIGLGHKKIAFIKGNPNQYSSGERLRGFKDAMTEHSIGVEKGFIAPGLFTYKSGLKAARKLLALPTPPTAIFASNDDMAAATLAVAASRGLEVPKELSVAGFDDSPLASAVFPRLTTVKQPLSEMAAEAISALLDMVSVSGAHKKEPLQRVTMEFRLVRGASTAAPK